ncbi:hypothetical protein E2C01_068630 [Portunus trituberculatus]|uniref:Uncharacterized protein n=1 Tax=Portunus trituberculatus TaxID=210409 RepID=A0A5B7HWF2_PORTR|nr:hypothetical protein [Portunus trituberculatus]
MFFPQVAYKQTIECQQMPPIQNNTSGICSPSCITSYLLWDELTNTSTSFFPHQQPTEESPRVSFI